LAALNTEMAASSDEAPAAPRIVPRKTKEPQQQLPAAARRRPRRRDAYAVEVQGPLATGFSGASSRSVWKKSKVQALSGIGC